MWSKVVAASRSTSIGPTAPKTLHGVMTHGFPNQFYTGYIQGGLNASVTEQFGRQGHHIAYVISEALKRGAKVVEPSQEAQDAYVRHFEEVEFDILAVPARMHTQLFHQ